jgi:hypothetical protein
LAGRLGEKLREINSATADPLVILMGDFNDEPFDESMVTLLPSTRDRTLARAGGFLYNPFWRFLGEMVPYRIGENFQGHGGTFFHRAGVETRWLTFDQILFSSAFV